ncbi:reticulocalbin-2-like [Neltuma alba]|uniref:reticulocalbin-2-like n=1 Tax=Neltuma alba TaxID=207710 RepID=UPI0010A59940|nr:reticulocalbin-2-like [Prosopis alba]
MKKVVVYAVIATAFLFFFVVLSPLIQDQRRGPCLNRRFGYNIRERGVSFDPLERRINERSSSGTEDNGKRLVATGNNFVDTTNREEDDVNVNSNTTVFNEVMETYQYLTAGGKLNTTLRLTILFPLLDRDPKDYLISFNELEAWILQQSMDRLDYMTSTELNSKDKDGDSAISFRDYLPQFSDSDIEKKGMVHGEAGWWQERFETADLDHNGLLNFTELKDFLHPEDSKNEGMQKWLLRDRMKRMDYDNDGKLNFKEFEDHVYGTYVSYVEFETAGKNVPQPQQKFHELDVNNDNFLSVEELMPILRYLYPGELAYARFYTIYLINEADDNDDGKLSLQEMINHEIVFYHTVHADDSHDDHDEL